MSILPAALAVFGMGASFFGRIAEGQAQQAAFEFNAAVSRQQAAQSVESRKLELFRKRKAAKTFTAKQSALFAKAGVLITGSPLETMAADIATLELDMLIGDFNASLETNKFLSDAELATLQGREAVRSSRFSAFATLLTTAGLHATLGTFNFQGVSTTTAASAPRVTGALGPQRTGSFLVR